MVIWLSSSNDKTSTRSNSMIVSANNDAQYGQEIAKGRKWGPSFSKIRSSIAIPANNGRSLLYRTTPTMMAVLTIVIWN